MTKVRYLIKLKQSVRPSSLSLLVVNGSCISSMYSVLAKALVWKPAARLVDRCSFVFSKCSSRFTRLREFPMAWARRQEVGFPSLAFSEAQMSKSINFLSWFKSRTQGHSEDERLQNSSESHSGLSHYSTSLFDILERECYLLPSMLFSSGQLVKSLFLCVRIVFIYFRMLCFAILTSPGFRLELDFSSSSVLLYIVF